MNLRSFAILALLVVTVCLERCGYYGARSFLSLDLHQEGTSTSSIGMMYSALQAILIVGTLLGGALALAVGPRAAAAAAALLATCGHFVHAAGAPVMVGAAITALGAGLFRPCPYAAAAETLVWDDPSPAAPGPHRYSAVAAFAVIAYAAVNLGGLVAPALGGFLRDQASPSIARASMGAVTLLAALAAGGAALIAWLGVRTNKDRAGAGPYRAATPGAGETPSPPLGMALGGLALLMPVEAVFMLGSSAGVPPFELLDGKDAAWLMAVNPIVTIFISTGLFALLLTAAIQRWTLPPLLVLGAGLCVYGVGLAVLAAAGTSKAGFVIGSGITGAGEPACFAIPIAYAAIAKRGRAAALIIAVWMTAGQIVSVVTNALSVYPITRIPLLVLGVLVALGGGAALIALGRRMHSAFFDAPAPAAPAPWPPAPWPPSP